MRGLLRNNLYLVESSLKWGIGFCILLNIVVAIALTKFSGDAILTGLMLGQIGGFVGLTGTALQKDEASKWSKYERTLPVRVRDVVMARYISFLIFSSIGILLATITVILWPLISGEPLNFERVGYGYTAGIVFAFFVPALVYPMVLKFGADKVQFILMISVVITLALFVGSSMLWWNYLGHLNHADSAYRVTWITASIGTFIESYFLSISIHKKKEF